MFHLRVDTLFWYQLKSTVVQSSTSFFGASAANKERKKQFRIWFVGKTRTSKREFEGGNTSHLIRLNSSFFKIWESTVLDGNFEREAFENFVMVVHLVFRFPSSFASWVLGREVGNMRTRSSRVRIWNCNGPPGLSVEPDCPAWGKKIDVVLLQLPLTWCCCSVAIKTKSGWPRGYTDHELT